MAALQPLGPWLAPRGIFLEVSDAARQALGQALPELPLPERPIHVRFGFTAAASAFAVSRVITLNGQRYGSLDRSRQLGLLAHELVHVAQYAMLAPGGVPRFLLRYAPDYFGNPDNYRVPEALLETPLAGLSLLDPRYTLDQIAERFRHELSRRRP